MLIITPDNPIGETAGKLIADLCEELSRLYGTAPSPFSLSEAAVERTIFLVARDEGAAVGCGALRRIDDETAEVKRMYVAPNGRRKGIGRGLLFELERHAVDFGYRSIRLQTGALQPEARRLYESSGYHRIPAFGKYVEDGNSVCYEKMIA